MPERGRSPFDPWHSTSRSPARRIVASRACSLKGAGTADYGGQRKIGRAVLDGPLQGMLYGSKCRQDTFSTTHSRAYQEDVSVQDRETPSPARARRGSGGCWRPAHRRCCSRRRLARRGERQRPGAVRYRDRRYGRAAAATAAATAGWWGHTHGNAFGASASTATAFDRNAPADGCAYGAPADRVADGAGTCSCPAEACSGAATEHGCRWRGRYRYQPAAAGNGWSRRRRDDRWRRVRAPLSQARGLASSTPRPARCCCSRRAALFAGHNAKAPRLSGPSSCLRLFSGAAFRPARRRRIRSTTASACASGCQPGLLA